jgi:undecaprenyl diphosphate synthase
MSETARDVPWHVAIIMDGNRRCAARDAGVEILTVYGFSTENWKRDKTEISLLLDLCVYFAQSEINELCRNDVRVRIIGHYQALPRASREALDGLVERTAGNRGLQLNLAVNYSARAELRDVVAGLAADVAAGRLEPEAIDESVVESRLYTAQWPDPELLIRPGGESRLSNFLLFQVAHTELYLSDVFWPDFGAAEFARALAAYRERRLTALGST